MDCAMLPLKSSFIIYFLFSTDLLSFWCQALSGCQAEGYKDDPEV